jgi:hypothetical protein
MASENIFIIHPENAEQVNALKAFIKALNMKFETTREQYYHPEFVAKLKKSREEFQAGNFMPVEKEDLQSFLGLQ